MPNAGYLLARVVVDDEDCLPYPRDIRLEPGNRALLLPTAIDVPANEIVARNIDVCN